MENQANQQNNGHGFAIASLIIGIFAFLLSFIPCINFLAIPVGAAAIIFGIVAITKASKPTDPKGMGIAGISLGGVAIFIAIFMWVFVISSKDLIQNRFENFFEWAEEFEDEFDDELKKEIEDTESLENLERALDELEGTADEVKGEIDEALNEVRQDVKEAIDDAKEEIEEAKQKHKEKLE